MGAANARAQAINSGVTNNRRVFLDSAAAGV